MMPADCVETARTTDQLLGLARARIPPALISPGQYDRMVQIASCIPAAFVAAAGAECPLTGEATADFGIAVSRYGFGQFPSAPPPVFPPPYFSDESNGVWQTIWQFGRCWGADARHLNVRGLWLEFDTSRAHRHGLPNVLVSLDPQPRPALLSTLRTALAALGTHVAPAAFATLDDLLEAAGGRMALLHAGAMLARGYGALRVCMHVVQPEGVESMLESMGCGHAAAELRAIARSEAAPYLTCVLVSFDVQETIGTRVGIECFLQPKVPWDTRGYRRMLDDLLARRLCEPAKAAAVLTMCAARPPAVPSAKLERMLRCLSHFKIVTTATAPPAAKVYFYAIALAKTIGFDGAA